LIAFLATAVIVIVTPGQDTALTICNTLVGGRRSGVRTAAGVFAGNLVWVPGRARLKKNRTEAELERHQAARPHLPLARHDCGLIIGASAVTKYVYYWNDQGHRYSPAWVTYLVVVVVVLAVLSPILTWPRPWRLWKIRG
jgi:hypothetical protein